VFERVRGESVGFVDHEQFDVLISVPAAVELRAGAHVLVDAGIDAGGDGVQLVDQGFVGGFDLGGVEDGSRAGEGGVDFGVAVLARAPGVE
jgi:hypothetical protein